MAHYEIWLARDDGTRLALLTTPASLEYAIVLHDVGACVITLPGNFDVTLLAVDRRLEIWRAPVGGSPQLERVYLIRRLRDATDANGRRTIVVTGVDGNELLRRRIVAYAAGSAQAAMTDEGDDLVRAIVYDNLGPDAAAARQIASTYLTFAAERSAGPSVTAAFARRNVLRVCQDIAEACDAAGTPVYWHMADSGGGWEFQTFTGQPGQDHTYPNGQNPVLLALELGNLAEPALDADYSGEITYAYAGGQGEEENRIIATAEDTARSGRSLFGRREGWQDARQCDTTAGVTAAAQRLLTEGQPKQRFTGKIIDTAGTRYGIHWRWGDRVTAVYCGQSYDALVRAVSVRVDENGREDLTARLEVT